jgi:hypothetical protein
MQMFARLFVFIGTILAYLAYFPPTTVQEKLGIQEQINGEHNMRTDHNIEFYLKDETNKV